MVLERKRCARERAQQYVAGLDRTRLFLLGDALVLGTYDWREWFDSPAERIPAYALDEARMLAEEGLE